MGNLNQQFRKYLDGDMKQQRRDFKTLRTGSIRIVVHVLQYETVYEKI